MIVLIDQDGPLADLEQGFLDAWQLAFPNEVFVPLEERTARFVDQDYPPHLRAQVQWILHQPGFYLNLPAVPGSIEAVYELLDLKHEVFICTTPLPAFEHCVLEKYLWVQKHLGRNFTRKLIFTRDKTLVRGQVLIDDNPEIGGLETPEWEHVIFDCPQNKGVAPDKRRLLGWENWKDVFSSVT